MVRLLIYVSVAYAAILVLALAAVLLTIWLLLVRVSQLLRRIKRKLGEVARLTQPLPGQLGAVTTAAVTAGDEATRGVDALVAAAKRHPSTVEGRR